MRTLTHSLKVNSILILVVTALSIHTQAQDAPPPSSMDDSFAAVVIGDLPALVNGVVGIVDQVMPGMGAMIPAQVGGFLGDPELEGFSDGDGAAGIIFPGDLMVVFAEVNPDKHDAYSENAANMGLQAASSGSMLILSDDEVGIEVGKKIAGEVKGALLTDNPKASIHALVHVPKIKETFQTEIDQMLESLPEMMEAGMTEESTQPFTSEGFSNILEAEVLALYHFLSQLEILELELSPSNEGISLELSFMPLEKTNFSTLLTQSKGGDSGSLIQMVPGSGAIRSEASFDGRAYQEFIQKELEKIIEEVDWTSEEEISLKEWSEQTLTIYGNGFAASMLGEPGSESFLNGSFIYDVEDTEKALAMFRDMNSQMDSMGFLDLYSDLGMEMEFEFQENSGEHKGVSIHRMEMKMDLEGMDESEDIAPFMNMFTNFTYHIATLDNYLLYTMGDSSIENLIDLVQSGGDSSIGPLASRTHFGEGGSAYGDISLEGYIRMFTGIMKGMPQEEEGFGEFMKTIQSVESVFQGAPPISMSLFADTLQAKLKLYLPSALMQRISQAAMGAMMSGASGGN